MPETVVLYEDSGAEPSGPREGAALSFVGQLVRCPEGLHQGCPRAWLRLTEAWPDALGPVQRGACPPGLLFAAAAPAPSEPERRAPSRSPEARPGSGPPAAGSRRCRDVSLGNCMQVLKETRNTGDSVRTGSLGKAVGPGRGCS